MELNKVEELFGTLQQSVVASWRKHLKTNSYSKHMALDEFYKEMPEKVDKLIEDYIGEHENLEEYINVLDGKPMDALEYLEALKALCEEGRKKFIEGNTALESDMDDILSFIDGVIYKVRQLSENKKDNLISLSDYIRESLETVNEGNINYVERKYREFCGMCKAYNVDPKTVEVYKTPKNNWRVMVDGKKKFLVSRNILDEEVIEKNDIKKFEKKAEQPVKESIDINVNEDANYARLAAQIVPVDAYVVDDAANFYDLDDFDDMDAEKAAEIFGNTRFGCIIYHKDGDDADMHIIELDNKLSDADAKKMEDVVKKMEEDPTVDFVIYFPEGI